MAVPIPSFSRWKNLLNTPSQRRIRGNQNKFDWGALFKPIGDVIGLAFGGLEGLWNWTATKVVQLVIASKRFVLNFDWNIPDESLEAQLEAQKLAWYGQFGGVVGQALAWVTCGLLPSVAVMGWNKPLGLKILYDVGEEAYDELTSELAALLQTSARMQFNALLINSFIKFRSTVRGAANETADPFTQFLADGFFDIFPQFKEAAKHWGDKGSKPFIINNEVEELIENSPLPETWKNFLEEAWEEFNDTCDEALLVFANSFDDHVAQESLREEVQTEPNTIVVTPNRLAPDERLILHGTREQLRFAIPQAIANHQVIFNKDVGYNLGMPLIQRAFKQISEYVIQIFLESKPKPPYGYGSKGHEITINSGDKTKFTNFSRVIRALGGGSEQGNFGYNFGNYLAIAQMSDGSELKCWTDSEEHAQERIEALVELSEATIQTLNITIEIKDYERKKIEALAKDVYKVYPSKISIVRKTKIYDDYDKSFKDRYTSDGSIIKATRQGYYKHSPTYTLLLWGEEPPNWEDVMFELTKPIIPV